MNHITTLEPETFGTTSRAYSDGQLHPVTGWPLDGIARLDAARSGFMVEVCRSRPRWRQAFYAALSAGILDEPAEFLSRCGADDEQGTWGRVMADLANALLALEPQDIVVSAMGSCPQGYLSVCERLGLQAFRDRGAYGRLHDMFVNPERGHQRRVVLQVADFNEDRLEVVERLDRTVLSPSMVLRVKMGVAADRLNHTLALIRRHCSTATDEALAKSASDLKPDTSWHRFVRSWLERADQHLPEPPWIGDETVRPLRTAADLARAGLETRTCLATRVPFLVSGRVSYFLAEGPELAICCVIRLGDGAWLLSRIAGHNNRVVSCELSAELRGKFRAVGIQVMAEPVADMDFARLMATFDPYGFDEFDLDGPEGP